MASQDDFPDLELSRAQFYFEGDFSDPDALEKLARETFHSWRLLVYQHFEGQDVGVALHMEEGSLKGKALVLATILALYEGIANYPSFKEGLSEMVKDGRNASEGFFKKEPLVQIANESPVKRMTYDAGTLEELQGIFERVKLAQLTPTEGVTLAIALLEKYGEVSETQRNEIETSLVEMPKYGKQTEIPVDSTGKRKPRQSPKPRKETPAPTQETHWVIDIRARDRRSKPEVKRRKVKR